MPDLTDIFETPAPDPAPSPADLDPLIERANEVAQLRDLAVSARSAYKARYEEELDAVNERLAALKDAADRRAAELDMAATSLKEYMEQEDVVEIPLLDRPPIILKTIPPRKKGITLTWLKTYLGDPKKAKALWEAQPKSDPATELVIPPPHDDEPISF